jgi:hypothetical protein
VHRAAVFDRLLRLSEDHAVPKPATKPSITQTTLDLLGSDFVEDVSRYIVPIFADINGAPVSMGTGFLVNTGQDHILVTAAHVLDRLTRLPHYFYVEQKVKRALTPPVLVSKLPPSGDRADDLVDVGVVILRNEGLPPYPAVGRDSMPPNLISPYAMPRAGKKFAFLGYPSTKGKADRAALDLRSASYAYLSGPAPAETYTKLDLNPRFHIVLPFSKRGVVDLDGKSFNFPKPNGISGAPLWELQKPEAGGRKVVGIMIEHRRQKGVLVATDIAAVLLMLSDYYEANSKGNASSMSRD